MILSETIFHHKLMDYNYYTKYQTYTINKYIEKAAIMNILNKILNLNVQYL